MAQIYVKTGHNCLYNGTGYRSKLEARWALHFDFFNIQAQYEPERFYMKDWSYLPDFYLQKGFYVEIKPNFEKFIEEKEKYIAFSDAFEASIACCIGLPCAFKWQWYFSRGKEYGVQLADSILYKQFSDLREMEVQHKIAYACQFSSFEGKDPYILPIHFEREGTELIIKKPE